MKKPSKTERFSQPTREVFESWRGGLVGQTRKPWSNSHALRALFFTWKGAWKVSVSTMVVWLRLKLNTKICAGNGKTAGINLFFDLQKVADSISVVEEGLGNKFLQKLHLKGWTVWDILWCNPLPGRAWTVRRRVVWRIVAKESMFLCIEKVGFFFEKASKNQNLTYKELREELQARQHMHGGLRQQHGCGNGCGKTWKDWMGSSKGLSRIEGPLFSDVNQ